MTILHGQRVTLRPLHAEDIAPLSMMFRDPEIAQWWVDPDEASLRAQTLDDPGVTPFAIELGGELIGLIMYTEELDPYYKYASVDLTLGAPWLGQGFGSDALRTICRHLFEERGHHRITIDPSASNARAIAAYKKVGFEPVGIMRQYELGPGDVWRDGLLMDLLKREIR